MFIGRFTQKSGVIGKKRHLFRYIGTMYEVQVVRFAKMRVWKVRKYCNIDTL